MDEVTASDALGFRIDHPSGRLLAAGLVLDLDSKLAIFLVAHDNGDHDLKVEVNVTAVDRAGNESAPIELTTGSEGSKRCQLARDLPGGALSTLALLALVEPRACDIPLSLSKFVGTSASGANARTSSACRSRSLRTRSLKL
jgi:hypothetical protein